jgi:hypothetical protein
MDYYAATLREPGTKLNNDGLMVKGIRFRSGQDMVVMAFTSCGKDAKTCDKVIRYAEKIFGRSWKRKDYECFQKLFGRFGKRGFLIKRTLPEIAVLILDGIDYRVMMRGNIRIMRAGRLGIHDICGESKKTERDGYSLFEGRLPEGSTIIAGNSAFYERQSESDIRKRLCPQMCTCMNEMQRNMEYLGNQLWSRGEIRPITAAAICVK